jgi:hypothetical protein
MFSSHLFSPSLLSHPVLSQSLNRLIPLPVLPSQSINPRRGTKAKVKQKTDIPISTATAVDPAMIERSALGLSFAFTLALLLSCACAVAIVCVRCRGANVLGERGGGGGVLFFRGCEVARLPLRVRNDEVVRAGRVGGAEARRGGFRGEDFIKPTWWDGYRCLFMRSEFTMTLCV